MKLLIFPCLQDKCRIVSLDVTLLVAAAAAEKCLVGKGYFLFCKHSATLHKLGLLPPLNEQSFREILTGQESIALLNCKERM